MRGILVGKNVLNRVKYSNRFNPNRSFWHSAVKSIGKMDELNFCSMLGGFGVSLLTGYGYKYKDEILNRAKEIAETNLKAIEERRKEIFNTIRNATPTSKSKVLQVKEELEELVEKQAKEIVLQSNSKVLSLKEELEELVEKRAQEMVQSNSNVLDVKEELEKFVEKRAKEIIRKEIEAVDEQLAEAKKMLGEQIVREMASISDLFEMKKKLRKLELNLEEQTGVDDVIYYSTLGVCVWALLKLTFF
ncbi:PREDICTED: probable inactive protein kinase DDB_G0270444 [Erythranthe guttata]|uniref:probable inactive protein kinase DDB_G0270444 n=1 Tax=Erythranthe guttata TaxID=4155 RepID=UPI00064DF4D1|nr:PREDICTED: probable inactive protein kinase DDB_G0270444 [Erythranthe guttata]|eukprot:XP_012852621.1 PREDICTED: probable inactive protein kinase DDB_G0270444 [Erythranthe guttata]